MKMSVMYALSLCFFGWVLSIYGATIETCERRISYEQPISLRMFKYIDFISAFDAVYTNAIAMDEVDALPKGFVRAWEAIKSGREVVELQDLIVALPVLYYQLLLARSCAVPDNSYDRLMELQEQLAEIEQGVLEVMIDFEQRLCALETAAEDVTH